MSEKQDKGMCFMLEPDRRFYNDLSKEEQEHWVAELKPCPAIAQLTPITQTAYTYHPTTYLFCEGDQALPVELQRMMVQQAEKKGAVINKETCSAGHSPFLSQPETVLNLAKKIVSTA